MSRLLPVKKLLRPKSRAFLGGAGGLPYTQNLTAATTTKLLAGYQAMQAGTRNMVIAFDGDSVDRGVDETALPYNSQYQFSVAEQLAALFRNDGIASGANNWYGISGTSLNDYVIRDKRITVGGTTAMGSSVIQGGAGLSMSSATATMTFTPQQNCNTADIYTLQNSAFNGATLAVSVDGGAATNIVQNATTTIRKTTISLGSVGAHTITISWVSGSNALYGIDCYDNTRKEVTVRQWAQSGATVSQMIDNSGTPSAGRINQMNLFPPDVVLGDIGVVNSWRNATAVATVKTQAETFIDAVHAAGADFIFVVPPFDSGSAGNTANQQQYIDAITASCIAKGCAVFNLRAAPSWTSKAVSDAAGYTSSADFVHKTIAGQANTAALLKPMLRYGMRLAPSPGYASQMLVALGQSNMMTQGISGASGLPSGWVDTSRVQMWNGSAFATYSPGAATNWGPETPYAKAWLDANPTGTLYIVKSAVSNTQLGAISTYGAANGATQDWSENGALYPPAKAAILAAKATLPAPANVTTMWMQGETDAMASNLATAYQSNVSYLFAKMRADFGANVIICGAVNDSRAWLYKDQVIAAQIAVERRNNFFVTADDLALQSDGFHYTTTSANAIGTALFNAIAGGSTANRVNNLSPISKNCDPLITVSNSDLTATVAAGATGNGTQVIGKRGATSGKKFYAATIGAVVPAAGIGFGLATDTFAVATTYLGGNTSSVCLFGNNVVALNGAVVGNYFTLTAGDACELAVDLGAKLAWFRKNGGTWNAGGAADPATGVGGLSISTMTGTSYYPALSLQNNGESWVLNNSATPPSGYTYFGS